MDMTSRLDPKNDEGIIRQRRNLIIISLIVSFLIAGDVTFKEINILGSKALVGQPNTVYYFLGVGWFYLLFRYYQYFLGFKKEAFEPFVDILKENSKNFISEKINQEPNKYLNDVFAYRNTLEKGFNNRIVLEANCKRVSIASQLIEFSNWDGLIRFYKKDGTSKEHNIKDFKINLELNEFKLNLIKAFSHFVIQKKAFTDYIFPYFIALTPILCFLLKLQSPLREVLIVLLLILIVLVLRKLEFDFLKNYP